MATSSSGSSSAGSRRVREATPLCPFCKTPTVVERISKIEDHPDVPFFTCRNRDWGSKKCTFFMWKPSSGGNAVDAASVIGGLTTLQISMSNLNNVVYALSTDVNRVVGQQRVNKCLNVATVIVGVMSFAAMFMFFYGH